MPTLYHCMSARSFRPLWTLTELGLPYELIMLPFPPRVHARHYLNINPLGTIPLFIDGETRMTESAAICEYLAFRHDPGGLALAPEDPHFGAFLNWTHFGEATLTFPQTLIFRYSRLEPKDRQLPQVVEDYTRWFLGRLKGIEAALSGTASSGGTYLCADRFTIADISVGYALMLAADLNLEARFPPAVQAYWQRLKARASYGRALAAQEQAALAQGVPLTPAVLVS